MKESIEIPQRAKRRFLAENFNTATWAEIEPYFQQLSDREINSEKDLLNWLKDWSELEAVLEENSRWIYVKTSIDTTDEKAKADLANLYQHIYPFVMARMNELEKKFIACPFTDQLDKDLFFTTIRKIKKKVEMFREENIPLLSELSLKQSEFDQISGAQSITYQGTEMTLQQAAAFFKSKDREQRKDIFQIVNERRQQDVEALDNLLSELISIRHRIALNAGYKNYMEYRFDELGRFDYTPADCLQFHQSVKETVLPLLNKLADKRKNSLKLGALRPWDGEVDMHGKDPLQPIKSSEELIDKTIACFNHLDTYFGERIQIMREMKYLDLESRMNKGPGGFNMTMPEIGVPFIFMNSANTEHDVVTMVHEGGHAVHTFLSHGLALNTFKEVGSEIAEVASMSMELMSMEYWDIFYTNTEDLNRARQNHLEHILNILTKTCVGDSFQFWLYQHPEHTVAERREKWKQLFLEYSAAAIDWSGYENYLEAGYQKILHFYIVPLYYIEYAFAQLGALAVWKNFKADPKQTVENYKNALSLGYTRPISEFYKAAGAKFDFSKPYVAELMSFLEGEIDKLY